MRYQRKLKTLFVPLCLLIILCIGFSIAQDYSRWSMAALFDAASDTAIAMALFNDEDPLTALRNDRDQLEADLRFQTPHYVLAAAVRLALEEKIKPWQALYDVANELYNEAESDVNAANIKMGIADSQMGKALAKMEEALQNGDSESYHYWSGIYSMWQQEYSYQESERNAAKRRSDAAYTDMIRIWIVLEPLKRELQLHNAFTYNPLEAERNMMLFQLSSLNIAISIAETYYRNLELTAQALQAEINRRRNASPSQN